MSRLSVCDKVNIISYRVLCSIDLISIRAGKITNNTRWKLKGERQRRRHCAAVEVNDIINVYGPRFRYYRKCSAFRPDIIIRIYFLWWASTGSAGQEVCMVCRAVVFRSIFTTRACLKPSSSSSSYSLWYADLIRRSIFYENSKN